jgi:hypothetical protein
VIRRCQEARVSGGIRHSEPDALCVDIDATSVNYPAGVVLGLAASPDYFACFAVSAGTGAGAGAGATAVVSAAAAREAAKAACSARAAWMLAMCCA